MLTRQPMNYCRVRKTTMKRVLLTLLTLVLASFACVVPVPNSLPTATRAALGTPTKTPNAAKTPNAPVAAVQATISQAVVTVRKSAGGEATGNYLKSGDRVQVIKCTGDWCEIKKPRGFVFRGCISELADGLLCQARP